MDADEFVFYKSASLKNMAAQTAALRIWHSYISRSARYYNQEFADGEDHLGIALKLNVDYKLECDEQVRSLQLPQYIENILKQFLKNIQTEISDWISSFEDFVFDRGLKRYKYRVRRIDVNCCVWTPNCAIDYVKTASKMLSVAALSKVQKFIIMCKYCMENEILNFPLYSLDWDTRTLLLDADGLLEYWMCKLERTSTPWRDRDMELSCENYNRYAFQYFWERLRAENQVTVAARILPSASGNRQLSLLPKMSDWHQRKLICKVPAVIMKNFICWLNMPENAILCWTKTKNIMTDEAFLQLVLDLLRVVEAEDGTEHTEDCHTLLVHIWDTASDCLKNYVLKMAFDNIVRTFFHKFHNHSESGLTFMLRILSSTTPEYRKSFMLENAIKFATNIPVLDKQLTSDLIEFCLPNIDDRRKFKKLIMTSDSALKKHYLSLL